MRGAVPQILLVQQDRELAENLGRVLAARGYETVVATSCREAETLHRVFDVGVFDLRLRDGSGTHLAARLSGFGRVRSRLFYTNEPAQPASRRPGEMGPVIRHGTPLERVIGAIEAAIAHNESTGAQARSMVRPSVPVPDAKTGNESGHS